VEKRKHGVADGRQTNWTNLFGATISIGHAQHLSVSHCNGVLRWVPGLAREELRRGVQAQYLTIQTQLTRISTRISYNSLLEIRRGCRNGTARTDGFWWTAGEQENPIGQVEGFFHIVRDQHDRVALPREDTQRRLHMRILISASRAGKG
jgi:hypothetical protein